MKTKLLRALAFALMAVLVQAHITLLMTRAWSPPW